MISYIEGIGEPYRLIETAEEAKEMLRYFEECGLCVSTCPTGARQLVRRKDYKHEDKLTTGILLG